MWLECFGYIKSTSICIRQSRSPLLVAHAGIGDYLEYPLIAPSQPLAASRKSAHLVRIACKE